VKKFRTFTKCKKPENVEKPVENEKLKKNKIEKSLPGW
jgi:hypothetical protein